MVKKRKFSIGMILGLVLLISQSAFAFQDIEGDPAETEIIALQKAGIISGINEEKFAPNEKVSYAQGVHMIAQGLDLNLDRLRFTKEPKASDMFANVADDAWYAPSMIAAFHNGVPVKPDVDPSKAMTREQFASYLYAGLAGKVDYASIELWVMIADEKSVTEGHMNAIQELVKTKIAELDAVGNFRPQNEITRSEAVRMLYNAIQFVHAHSGQVPSPPAQGSEDVKIVTEKVNEGVNKVTLSWGLKPNSGYQIRVEGIEFTKNDEAVIRYSLHYPEKGHMYAQVITEPKAETYVSSEYQISLKQQ